MWLWKTIIGLNCLGVSYNNIRISTQKENYRLVCEIYERFVRITNSHLRSACLGSWIMWRWHKSCWRSTWHRAVWLKGRVQLKRDGTRWRTGGEGNGKLAKGVGSQYPSHYLGTWCIQHHYRWCAHLRCK